MLTATCNALSFQKDNHVSGMVGGIYADDNESLSPLGGHRAGGSEEGSEEEEDDADDVLPASKKAASDTCPDCGTVFQRPGNIHNHRGKAACVKAQQRQQVRGLRRPRLSLSHPLHLAENRTPGRWRWWRSSSATLQPAAGTAGCGADPGGLGGAP